MAKDAAGGARIHGCVVPVATAQAAREAADIQSVIDAQHGGFALAPWDWDFYAEQVRRGK